MGLSIGLQAQVDPQVFTLKQAVSYALENSFDIQKAKLNIETSEFSKDKIQELLSEKGVDTGAVSEFNELLSSCEFARYAPSTKVEMEQDYDKASRVISILDKQIR